MASGPGFGNKSQPEPSYDANDTHFDLHHHSDPYIDAGTYGSGMTGGAGIGNKTGEFKEKHDSTVGKVMEKVGGVVHSPAMVEKGIEKRKEAGYTPEK